jgi:uncharacterized phage protein gp47/JayE
LSSFPSFPFQGDVLYKTRQDILASFLAELLSNIPDAYTGEDGNLYILFQIQAGQIEGLYLANQLLLQDMFPQSASSVSLDRYGITYAFPRKVGTRSFGSVTIGGEGGIYIPIGTEVAYDPGGDFDPLYFVTTTDGTTPNPGIPDAPTLVDGGAGVLDGMYQYTVTFLTLEGETASGLESEAFDVTTRRINVNNIPLGGPGTIARRLYRSLEGSGFKLVPTGTALSNNTTTTYQDNNAEGVLGAAPPEDSTAERITLDAQAVDTGVDHNAQPNTITVPTDVPDGITFVTNPVAFVGGTPPEDPEDFRVRLLENMRNPQSGSEADIKQWSEEVDGVESATVFANDNLGTPTNGHVTVRITGPDATIPPQSVLDAVLETLQERDMINLTIHVGTFTPLTVNVTVDITTAGTFTVSDVTPSVQEAIRNYVNSVPVNGVVYRAGIVNSVYNLPGVLNVVVAVPAADVTTTAVQKPVAGSVTVT